MSHPAPPTARRATERAIRLTLRALIPIALLGLGTSTLWAQDGDRPAGQFGEMVEVTEVLMDVLVTDRDGNVVLGLGPDDFTIVDDGDERPVTGASFYSNRFLVRDDAEGIQHPAVDEVLADRYFILFFHDQRRLAEPSNRLFRRQVQAARQAERWVREEMLQGDWVAVVGYDVKLKVFADYTQDREHLVQAIEFASRGRDPKNEWASRRPDALDDRPSLLAHLPAGKELRKQSTRMYDAMSLVAEASHQIVGRKNLLLFTIGFGELRNIAGSSGFVAGGVTSRVDERFYPDLEASLNDNNVAVYPIELTPPEFESSQQDFLQRLATDSGGRYHYNFVSFITPLRQIADEANGYYLLSYAAEHPTGENGYRDVKVEVTNPELRVRARTGYRFGT